MSDAGLVARLRGGVYRPVRDSRPADLDFRDADTLSEWPGGAFAAVNTVRQSPDAGQLAAIGKIADQLRSRRALLVTVLYSPDRVLHVLAHAAAGPVENWVAMCWTAEAAWCAITSGASASDAHLLRPLAARLRFLVLSEPMRFRGKPGEAWWGARQGRLVVGRAFGPESWLDLVSRCQEARREWLGMLNAYQDHMLLSQAEPAELEQEIRAVVFRDGRAAPLGLSARKLDQRTPLTAEDRSVVADVIERHLLPRFALVAVARLVLHDDSGWRMRGRAVLGLVTVLTGLASAGCAVGLLLRPTAIVLAVACYLLMCGSVLLPRGGLAPMWLLRMPAASAVGVVALISLMAGGFPATPPDDGYAVLALGGTSFGYLLIEARNHGVASTAAVRRAFAVWLAGAVHALMVSVIGLVAVAPAFVNDGGKLEKLWSHPVYGHAGMVLALATAWCLTVGVFSQILWDDRPITAPLAHLSWRGR